MWRQLAITWFAVQSVAVAGWWLMLMLIPGTRSLFAIHDAPFIVLGAFATGDLLVIAAGSAAVAMKRGRGWAVALAWVVTGAMLYGAAYTLTIAAAGSAPALGAALMVAAAATSVAAAAFLSGRDAVSTGPAA